MKMGNFVDGAGTRNYTRQVEIELADLERPCKLQVPKFNICLHCTMNPSLDKFEHKHL